MILSQRWVLVFFTFLVIHTGTHISLLTKHDLAVSDVYLPTALSIVLINWLGPKIVLPVLYLNSVATSFLWGNPVERWPMWFLFGIPELLFVALSWFLFRIVFKGRCWLPDNRNTILFLAFGILVPAVIEAFLLQGLLVVTGSIPESTFLPYVANNLLGEFAITFFLTVPALYYLTPWIRRKGFLYQTDTQIPIRSIRRLPARQAAELVIVFLCLFALVFFLEFRKHWYVYGSFSLYAAIRFGFGPAVLTNFYIMLLAYIFPRLSTNFTPDPSFDFRRVSEIFLGANFLFVFVAVTGRVISDIRNAEARLVHQNKELEKTTEELDRFVYSVSHDLSAPLKSILGLVNISRLTNDPAEHRIYVDKIEKSVRRLETFISAILDYSRTKRQGPVIERILLPDLFEEILDNLTPIGENRNTEVILDLRETEMYQDTVRLKVILTNLISNAFKFQKRHPGHRPFVRITSRKSARYVVLTIEDNGEGIPEQEQARIFEMFHRGSEHATGSGLGLYIAKEAATRIGATIHVKSDYGEGSVFTVKVMERGRSGGGKQEMGNKVQGAGNKELGWDKNVNGAEDDHGVAG